MPDAARRVSYADDDAARARALDIGRSFLVQAPAGSGKTELLIQRFLALLAHVDRPEWIVAMTFTRKAAGEMRERIVAALRDVVEGVSTDSPHAARTRELARAVLAHDARRGWQLIAHPSRLAVFTIDALASALARQAPLAAGLGGSPRYEERAAPLYAEAARAALATAPADHPSWRRLLAHLDNDAGRVVALLADLLAKRDQWMGVVVAADRDTFRTHLEAALAAEIDGEIAEAAKLVPTPLLAALAEGERYAAANLAASAETAELAVLLAACAENGGLPPPAVAAQPLWRALVDWLLVAGDARFRKSITAQGGFPAISKGAGAAERRQRNADVKSLLDALAAAPQLAEALHTVRCLPPPRYADDAWAIVDALLDILPRLAAQLTLTFRDASAIDFTQGTLAALDVLGAQDAPSDLLLKLDLQLRHLLIDEFQDTSFTQVDLIRRLTAGWQGDDGRTVFAVGDPMQSIYRFRGAEVRLFVEAQQRRHVADLPVENLVLRRNFRSQAGLVEWVNDIFPHVLGSRSDPWRGSVGFAAAVPVHEALPDSAATLDIAADADGEAQAVVGHVRAALGAGATDIAVLVRARSNLDRLLPALRSAEIPFAAVELDALAERQSIVDLVTLTHALTQPADRLAWLAVLRAPWCGLALADLFAVVTAADERCAGCIAGLVDAAQSVAGLSADGSARFAAIAKVLAPAMGARGRAGIAARVRGVWLALGGPACVDEQIDLEAAERFFALLAEHDVAGDVPDWPAFVDALRALRAAPDAPEAARVQVMTLHRAKGLQFDTVILPGLARVPTRSDAEILRWRRRPQGLLVASMKASGGDADPIHAYLGLLAAGEESAELGRLLYVGCTRAKRRLHLTAALAAAAKVDAPLAWVPPRSGSALEKFWGVLGAAVAAPLAAIATPPLPEAPRLLARRPVGWTVPQPEPGVPIVATAAPHADAIPFDWAREAARHAGTVAHRLFAQIARDGLSAWSPARIAALHARVRAELQGEGVDDAEREGAVAGVVASVSRMLADPRGRWLLDAGHADARCEWALAGVEEQAIARVVIDRSFVADGTRWIVDFKTGAHEGGDVDAFFDREEERYRRQLERYARFVRALDARPIRLGLYFPLQGGWREWAWKA